MKLQDLIEKTRLFYKIAFKKISQVVNLPLFDELKQAAKESSDGASADELSLVAALYKKSMELNDGFNFLNKKIRIFKNQLDTEDSEQDEAIDALLNKVLFDIKPKLQAKDKDSNQSIIALTDLAARLNSEQNVEEDEDNEDYLDEDTDLSGEDLSAPETDEAGPRNKSKSIFQMMEGQGDKDGGKGNAGYSVGKFHDPKDYANAVDMDISQYAEQIKSESDPITKLRIKKLIEVLAKLKDLYIKKEDLIVNSKLTGNELIDSEISKLSDQIKVLRNYIKTKVTKHFDTALKRDVFTKIDEKTLVSMEEKIKVLTDKKQELIDKNLENSPLQKINQDIEEQRKLRAAAKNTLRKRDLDLKNIELTKKLSTVADPTEKFIIEQEILLNKHLTSNEGNKQEETSLRKTFIKALKNKEKPLTQDVIKDFLLRIDQASTKKIPREVANIEQAVNLRSEINSGSLKGLLRDAVNKIATSKSTIKQKITDNIEESLINSEREKFLPFIEKIAEAKRSRNEVAKKEAFAALAAAINRQALNAEAEMHPSVIEHVTNHISKFEFFFGEIRKILSGNINKEDSEKMSSIIKYGNNLYLEYINKKYMGASADAVRKICISLQEGSK